MQGHGIRIDAPEFHSSPRHVARAQAASARHSFRPHRWSLAGCGGSADETRLHRSLPDGDFAHHGRRRFSGALEPPRSDPGHFVRPRRRPPRASSYYLGAPRRLSLGSGQHADHLRHSRHWFEHRVSALEFEQSSRHPLGISFLQRIASGGLAPLGRRTGRSAGHVRWGGLARDRIFLGSSRGAFDARRLGGARRERSLGHDVHSVPQGLPDGNEPAFVRHVFHLRRIGYDVGARDQLSRTRPVVARIDGRARRSFLADARWLHLGRRRSLSAIRREVCGHQPRHPALEYQPALGIALGNSRLWRAGWPRRFPLCASHRRLATHDAGSGRDCLFFGDRQGTIAVEGSGSARRRALRRRAGLRGSAHGRAASRQ